MTETSLADSFATVGGLQRHIAYAQLAEHGPVHPVTLPHGTSAWLITGYDEVRQALHDPRLIKGTLAQTALAREALPPEVFAALGQHMLNRDPPDHTRLRRLVATAFTQHRVKALAPRIQQITDELLDGLAGDEPVDLIAEFAYPLPITVICELLGIPAQRRTEFRAWSSVIMRDILANPEEFVAASTAMVDYLHELVTDKRAAPSDDLLSALVAVRDGADSLSEDELTSMGFLLLLAGHETTINLIGNGVHALLTHPEQLALLRAHPDLLSPAIEELLRFDGPVQVPSFRLTSEPVEIGGVTIPAGQIVLVSLLAANRDRTRIADPDVLDISREDTAHLAFGHGIHHCLGAPLARLEGRIALGALLNRSPRLRLAVAPDQLTWQPSMQLNGLTALPVLTY